jgi:hypothetical protein
LEQNAADFGPNGLLPSFTKVTFMYSSTLDTKVSDWLLIFAQAMSIFKNWMDSSICR